MLTKEKILTAKEIKSYLNPLYSDVSEELSNGQYNGYICDAITECADCQTSIYYDDQRKFYYENVDLCMRAFADFGYELKDFSDLDDAICKAGAVGEFLQHEQKAYDELDKTLQNYAINYILNHDIKITKKQLDQIMEEIDLNYSNYDRFDKIDDLIIDITKEN